MENIQKHYVVNAATKQAIDTFVLPASGFEDYVVISEGKRVRNESCLRDFGVRIEHPTDGKKWICLAGPFCRENLKCFNIASTSTAVKHLALDHGVIAQKTSTESAGKRKFREHQKEVRV